MNIESIYPPADESRLDKLERTLYAGDARSKAMLISFYGFVAVTGVSLAVGATEAIDYVVEQIYG